MFKKQSEKWSPLVVSHTSKAILLVHDYIVKLLPKLCPDRQTRDQLWDTLIVDKLRDAYCRAMRHTYFLLKIERGGTPTTFNHYFNANLQKKRGERISHSLRSSSLSIDHSADRYVSLDTLSRHVTNKDNAQQICEDIMDILGSYYKVARKRFVDTICQQVVNHFLLDDEESPLKILSPESIMSLDIEQLEAIAGEDVASKRRRQLLAQETESLEAALKVLRG